MVLLPLRAGVVAMISLLSHGVGVIEMIRVEVAIAALVVVSSITVVGDVPWLLLAEINDVKVVLSLLAGPLVVVQMLLVVIDPDCS